MDGLDPRLGFSRECEGRKEVVISSAVTTTKSGNPLQDLCSQRKEIPGYIHEPPKEAGLV